MVTFNISAQKFSFVKDTEKEKTCLGVPFEMPSTISNNAEAFTTFMRVMSLPSGARQQAFSELSNEDKATLFKVKLALQFIKRPNLTRDQKGLILETISTISADTYDRTNPAKAAQSERQAKELENVALRLFPRNDVGEIFADMNGDKSFEINLLARYEDLLKQGMFMRKQIINRIPINERVNIWQTQLIFHLATSTLRNQQKEFIVEIMPNIRSIIEASLNLSKEAKDKYLLALEANIYSVFTKPEGYSVFMTVGIQRRIDDTVAQLRKIETGFSLNFWNPQIMNIGFNKSKDLLISSKPVGEFVSCTCRSYCDPLNLYCGDSGCLPTETGCGPFDTWACTNRCQPIFPD